MASEFESDLRVDWDRKWLVDFNSGKTPLVSFDWSNYKTLVLDVNMGGSVLDEKSSFKIKKDAGVDFLF